jgi:NTE family protein
VYRVSEYLGAGEIGRHFGNFGEAALGVNVLNGLASFYSGVPLAVLKGERDTQTGLHGRFVSDTIDNLDFPQHGHLLGLDAELWRAMFGNDLNYDRFSITGTEAFGGGPTSVALTARFQTTAGTQVPLYQSFDLGGFLNMSGLRMQQILADRIVFLRTIVRQRVAESGTLLPGLFVGGSLEAADVRERIDPTDQNAGLLAPSNDMKIGAGSLFLSADSLLGPFYLGLGHSRGGQTSLYLYIGRP